MWNIHTHHWEQRADAIYQYPLWEAKEDVLLPDCYYSVGMHPWYLDEPSATVQWERLQVLAGRKEVVALGEAGFDKLSPAPIERQLLYFRRQVLLSETLQKPLILHCVRALDCLLAVQTEMKPLQPWIWHGFRGKPEQARQLVKRGFYLSFGARFHPESVREVPDDRIFIETDEAQLSIETLLREVAEVRQMEEGALRCVLQENVNRLFFKS